MPTARHLSEEAPLQPNSSTAFPFPSDHHLLVTTSRNIVTWDAQGTHLIFRSRRSSIVAAKEAADGSGVLAVASKNVVVVHDTKRGKEESWGLDTAAEDEVRHLEYSNHSRSLYLSTSTHPAIQHYSVETAKLLRPTHMHETAPIALAVSSTGQWMVSAAQHPSAVYLKSLLHNTPPLPFHPTASISDVSCVKFHPERPNIFMLAFRDGTVAAYDALRISRRDSDNGSSQIVVADGEISHLQRVHRATISGDTSLDQSTISVPIVGMAFLPGYKTRAVTAGRDGRCRLFDFANGGILLRTWHAKAPLTSIAVLPARMKARSSRQRQPGSTVRDNPAEISRANGEANIVIAVGRADGKVQIYDALGLLLASKSISTHEERILSVDWVQGDSPTPLADADLGQISEATSVPMVSVSKTAVGTEGPHSAISLDSPKSALKRGAEPVLSPVVRPLQPHIVKPAARQFTIHPDEAESGTVRHVPNATAASSSMPGSWDYLDLFSPVKPCIARSTSLEKVATPSKSRPRLSSQTFLKSPTDGGPVKSGRTSAGGTPTPVQKHSSLGRRSEATKVMRRTGKHKSPLVAQKFHTTSNHAAQFTAATNMSDTLPSRAGKNAKLLADLRRIANDQHGAGTLARYGVRKRERGGAGAFDQSTSHSLSLQDPSTHDGYSAQKPQKPAAPASDDLADDIWLTSDSTVPSRVRRRQRRPKVPGAYHHTGSDVDHCGPPRSDARSPQHPGTRPINHSSDEGMVTARSHLSPLDLLSQASQDMRDLFPRSSSLSPRKDVTPRRPVRPLREPKLTATTPALYTSPGQHTRDPWTRIKADRAKPSKVTRKNEFVTVLEDGSAETPDVDRTCVRCGDAQKKVGDLQNETARLKGEVLMLKAMLRRNGIPLPPELREGPR